MKSSLIELLTSDDYEHPTTSAQAVTQYQATSYDIPTNTFCGPGADTKLNEEGIENINKQMLALESLLIPMKQNNFNKEEEEEDDDDNDMDVKHFEITFINNEEDNDDDDDDD